MPKKPFLSAALATGVAVTGANAQTLLPSEQLSDHSVDIIEPAPDGLIGDWSTRDVIVTLDDAEGDLIVGHPEAVHAGDSWDIGIDFAQTYYGGAGGKDKITSGSGGNNITLDNGIKKGSNITLDNGIKRRSKFSTGAKPKRKQRGRKRRK